MRDPENFDAFYSGSVRRVIGQLYALTGSRAEAEDCVQEAYARAWQRWDKVSDYGDPEAWVRTVAYRISISTWRKAANMRAAHRRHGVPDDLRGMSPDYVAIIAIGAPTGTVKARLARGRQALAPHLTETDRAGTSLVPDPVSGREVSCEA
jgi:RNA polymerase sigma-70 factor (ECF subfamily)